MKRDEPLHDLELWEYVLRQFQMVPPLTGTMRQALSPETWQTDLQRLLARYFQNPAIFTIISQAVLQMRQLQCTFLHDDSRLQVTPFGWRYDRTTDHLFLLTAVKQTIRLIRTTEIQSVHLLGPVTRFDTIERYFDANRSIDSFHYRTATLQLHPHDAADEERILMKLSLYPKKIVRDRSGLLVTMYYETAYEPTFRRFLRTLGDRITVLSPSHLADHMEESTRAMLARYIKTEGGTDA
ncbi:hypothetical protein BLD48_14675 [Exiguobacterium sp. KRL4]|uniref:WYL domain-containing protein n=1 Tax=Exiguobacterium sp. KRL4 TaxID=1914536 RepID=UPI0008F81847|nr:WYL domain-containing protein [Exiguobacterium sp. KRL4]OIN65738.1 hypothetical protein BLD48_14675 [Exiguobacterium sp. KRL4]